MTISTLQTVYNEALTVGQAGLTVLGALGTLSLAISHLPLPPVWAERFARFAAYTSQKFSVNQRSTSDASAAQK